MNTCLMCGASLPAPEARNLHYSSLPGVILLHIPVTTCSTCGEEYEQIPHIEELNRLLTRSLVVKPGRLTGPELRFLRKVLGWSGTDLARRFGTDRSVVSRWEAGKVLMKWPTEMALRLAACVFGPVEDYQDNERMFAALTPNATPVPVPVVEWTQERWQLAA